MVFSVRKVAVAVSLISAIVLPAQQIVAQKLSSQEIRELKKREDSIKSFAFNIVFAQETDQRFRADSNFVRMLVRALKLKNSFNYSFDSLQTISRLYAPDSAFRIFTWQLKKDEYTYFHRGAIQIRTSDGSLKLIALHDVADFSEKLLDSVRSAKNWVGVIYYRIVLKTYQNKKYYTLLGYDDFSSASTKKWLEVMTFNENGEPVFGGPYISFKEDSVKKPNQLRFNIEYKKEAATTFNYDPDLDMILYDDLISENNEPAHKETYIPDGDFQAFKWENGQWVHVYKVFDFKLKDGEYPREKMILNDEGKPDEQKLLEQSIKNQKKQDSTSSPKKNGKN
jgi:hypothetical protein